MNCKIISMYIDSPQFKKRKVLNNKSQLLGGFGFQRIQLANYVAQQLNDSHKDDAAILQKFRRQAQEHKRNLLRKKHPPHQVLSQQTFQPYYQPAISLKNNSFVKQETNRASRQQMPFQTSDQDKNRVQYIEQKTQSTPIIIREFSKVPDQSNKYLARMLERKDKQLQKQAKIIRKSQTKLNDLKKRIEILQHEKKLNEAYRIASLEDNAYMKMKGIISSMSNKLEQNQSFLQQNLSEVKASKKKSLSSQKISMQSPNEFYPSQQILKKNSMNPQGAQQPKISYSKFQVRNQNDMKQERNGINSILFNLNSSRNRLDALGSFV